MDLDINLTKPLIFSLKSHDARPLSVPDILMISGAYVHRFSPCSDNLGHPGPSDDSDGGELLLSQDFLSCWWVICIMGFIYPASSAAQRCMPFLFVTLY